MADRIGTFIYKSLKIYNSRHLPEIPAEQNLSMKMLHKMNGIAFGESLTAVVITASVLSFSMSNHGDTLKLSNWKIIETAPHDTLLSPRRSKSGLSADKWVCTLRERTVSKIFTRGRLRHGMIQQFLAHTRISFVITSLSFICFVNRFESLR